MLYTGLFGGIAGACSVFGNTPIDVIKTRLQVSIWYRDKLFSYLTDFSYFLVKKKFQKLQDTVKAGQT